VRPTLLVIDDAKAVRLLVENTLKDHDCEVHEASNGFNAFFAIERQRPDLILLDLSMPVMDGMETLRRLKGAPELTDIPVILLPSPADRPLLPELLEMGAGGMLMKPFKPADLIEQIGLILPLKPAQAKSR
jgi:CheY-like chemotaxis protein